MTDVVDDPEVNRELFAKVADLIELNPNAHNQASWEDDLGTENTYTDTNGEVCGTTRCVAGWAIFAATGKPLYDENCWLHGVEGLPYTMSPDTYGAHLLGLTHKEASWLFLDSTNEVALEFVKDYAANGRPEDGFNDGYWWDRNLESMNAAWESRNER